MFRVLIVGNDMPMRNALNTMLSKMDEVDEIDEAGNGEDAIKICKENRVDVVFMDTQISGMVGIETGAKICKKYPETSVYMMANYISSRDLKEYIDTTVSGYLEKPFNFDEITRVLKIHQEEHETKTVFQMEYVNGIIQSKNYTELYYNAKKIVDSMYENAGNEGSRVAAELRMLGHDLCEKMKFYDDRKVDLEELFPLNDVLIQEHFIAEMWLYQVVDYIFWQNAINRYPLLANVYEYVNDNIKKEINLNRIVEDCSVSQGYLSRIFKSQFSTSVMEYLHMRKMFLAKGYFCFTEYSIAEIAFKLGYSESSYFSKVFKKYEHMTGKQFRNRIREK